MKLRKKLVLAAALLLALPVGGLISELVAPLQPLHDLRLQLAETPAPSFVDGGITLCLGGPEFMAALDADMAAAHERIVVQTLTFEADDAGEALAAAMVASPAATKTLLIDAYSTLVQSDKMIYAPVRWLDVPLGEETARTRRLLEDLEERGVGVVIGRPYGLGEDNLAARDHKKIMVVDDAAYVGGINFSDHNFLWRDLMVRIDDARVADLLAEDVARSAAGRSVSLRETVGDVEVVLGAGDGDPAIRDRILEAIASADESIVLECPYVTAPYFEALGEARRRGVDVTVLTAETCNRAGMKESIMDGCARNDLELRFVTGPMVHVKAMLVDGRALVLGSANFDFLSASLQPEVMVVLRDAAAIEAFEARVLGPDLARARTWDPDEIAPLAARIGTEVMTAARAVLTGIHER